jgi:ELWxxDGT repeat protein
MPKAPVVRLPLAPICLLIALFATLSIAMGQKPQLLADINAEPVIVSSSPLPQTIAPPIPGFPAPDTSRFVVLGQQAIFIAFEPVHGLELWTADSTPGSARLLRDISPGPSHAHPNWITRAGQRVFFVAEDGVHPQGLWVTDGSTAGTKLVNASGPCASCSQAGQITALADGRVLYTAHHPSYGNELWISDGTAAGTRLLADLVPGAGGSIPFHLCADRAGKFVYFSADVPGFGREPWFTDGKSTRMLRDVHPGSVGSDPMAFTKAQGALVCFSADDGTNGRELWATNGTSNGTRLLADINPGSGPGITKTFTVPFDRGLLFSALDNSGYAYWFSDGTPAGTNKLSNVAGHTLRAVAAGPVCYIWSDTLYVTDGSNSGTRALLPVSSSGLPYQPAWMSWDASSQKLFFLGNTTGEGAEPWVTDGTVAGTTLLGDVMPARLSSNPRYFTPMGNGKVLFTAEGPIHGEELWMSDGTAAGTRLHSDIHPNHGRTHDALGYDMSEERPLALRGRLFFQAECIQGYGNGLYVSSPDASDATPFFVPTHKISFPFEGQQLTRWGDRLAIRGFFDGWPFLCEGSPDSCNPLGPPSSTPSLAIACAKSVRDFVPVGDLLFFSGEWLNGRELFVSNGTDASGRMVKDIFLGTNDGCDLSEHAVLGRRILFVGNDGIHGAELWVSDGTAAGTTLVRDIEPNPNRSRIAEMVVLGKHAFFRAETTTHGAELWRSDGTKLGTQLLVDLAPGSAGSNPRGLCVSGQRIYFVADAQNGKGAELWSTDGTAAGTAMVADIATGSRDGASPPLVAAARGVFFAGNTGLSGWEPAFSDGTVAGTKVILDIVPGATDGGFTRPLVVGQQVYFVANDAVHGDELWRSDGTKNGTVLVDDLYPGSTSSKPCALTLAGGRLYFQATHPIYGKEMFFLEQPGAHAYDTGASCDGTVQSTGAPVLGSMVQLRFEGLKAGAPSIQLLGAQASQPVPFGSGCSLHLDLGQPMIIGALFVSTGSTWQQPWSIPGAPALNGITLISQLLTFDPATATLSTGNPWLLSLGQ